MAARVKVLREAKLENPMLVAGFPGAGNVGKLAVDNLIYSMKAQLFAKVYNLGAPARVFILDDGTSEPMSFSLYFVKGEKDLILATGYSQPESPEGQYEASEKILELARSLGCEKVYTFGAYIVDREVEAPRVFGTATSRELVNALRAKGIITMEGGYITGMNGIVFGLAPVFGMDGICLLGESPGYYTDGKAAKKALEAFSDLTGIKVDFSLIDRIIEEVDKTLERIRRERMMEERKKPSRLGYIS